VLDTHTLFSCLLNAAAAGDVTWLFTWLIIEISHKNVEAKKDFNATSP
jgi:hypothetical protein